MNLGFIGYADLTVVNFEELGITDPNKQRIYLQGIRGGAGLTDAFEQAVLNHIFTDPAWTPPATLYIGLSSTTPTEAGTNLTEPPGNAYARVATSASDWSAASGTTPAVKTNTATFTFPTATPGDWSSSANLTHFTLHDHVTNTAAANFVAWGALTVAKPVLNGDTASFAASAITFQLGDPLDTY
jgi:hypothetical protein